MKLTSKIFTVNELFSLLIIIGVSTFMLYTLSWGYIIHVGGIRFNNIPTPSLIVAEVWPKFMFARAFGRFSIPFMLFITIGVIVCLGRHLCHYMYRSSKLRRILIVSIMVFLVIAHINETRGYLKPPEVTYGNEIANIFGNEDVTLIKELLQDKIALMVVPSIRQDNKANIERYLNEEEKKQGAKYVIPSVTKWAKILYSLAFYSNIPISGAVVGLGVPPEQRRQFNLDINCILTGNVKELIDRYGDVAIAAPSGIAEGIFSKTNIPLKYNKLHDQDVVILNSST